MDNHLMQIKYDIRGVEPIQAWIRKLPHGTIRTGLSALVDYFIGDQRHGLKHYQPHKYVTRRKAYGNISSDGAPPGYKSWRQFRKVRAMIANGEILPGYPRRTGKTQRGYVKVTQNNGYRVLIENKEPGAVYTRHDTLQARLNALGGWLKESVVIANNTAGAFRHATAEVWKYLRKM